MPRGLCRILPRFAMTSPLLPYSPRSPSCCFPLFKLTQRNTFSPVSVFSYLDHAERGSPRLFAPLALFHFLVACSPFTFLFPTDKIAFCFQPETPWIALLSLMRTFSTINNLDWVSVCGKERKGGEVEPTLGNTDGLRQFYPMKSRATERTSKTVLEIVLLAEESHFTKHSTDFSPPIGLLDP